MENIADWALLVVECVTLIVLGFKNICLLHKEGDLMYNKKKSIIGNYANVIETYWFSYVMMKFISFAKVIFNILCA